MNSSALSMELSVSFVSWINDHLREEVEDHQAPAQATRRSQLRSYVFAGVACISLAVATILSR